jgi:hypothetical protein
VRDQGACLSPIGHQRKDVERRGVRGDDRRRRRICVDRGIERALGLRLFGDRLDDQIGAVQRLGQRRTARHRGGEPRVRTRGIGLADLAQRRKCRLHQAHRAIQNRRIAVGHAHPVPAQCVHQRQRVAHQPGPHTATSMLHSLGLTPPTWVIDGRRERRFVPYRMIGIRRTLPAMPARLPSLNGLAASRRHGMAVSSARPRSFA